MKNDIDYLYENYLKFTNDMAADHNPMAIAAVMTAIAMSIYKTAMDPADYDMMVDSISNRRDQVKSFDFNRGLQ